MCVFCTETKSCGRKFSMGRTPCCDKNGLKKGPWTAEEDQKLVDYIQKHGHGNWRTLPKNAGLERCGKSCRLRWTNYLRPDIKRGRFTFEEEETIIQLHSVLGNKWSVIASRLPGRTDNEIKNYWNTHIRKRLLKMGIDPVTHSPRLDLLDISSILSSSLSIPSQMNMTWVHPELLKLASSLVCSSTQNVQKHFDVQPIQHVSMSCPLSERQFVEANAEGYPSSIHNFSGLDQDYVLISNPTPLNSNKEEERESNGTNYLLELDIPEILDMNYEFM